MSYISKHKLDNETIHLDTYGHWIAFIQPIAVIPVMLATWVMLPRLLGAGDPTDFGYIPSYDLWGATSIKALLGVILLSALLVLTAWLRYIGSEYAVTSYRATNKQGIVFRHTGEMPLVNVESVHVDQTIPGRILGYGTVTLVGTGETHEKLKRVPDPIAFRTAAMQSLSGTTQTRKPA